ncbi:ankyrin repeat protein [mine drainage metagenome]|jgi:ankyrin repeat protein|uniref:Ankyrin repeat protein n=1 Tax=mine drainage metagenome TaxID=410659 RepID=A0A1J5R1B8_9ZZZZ
MNIARYRLVLAYVFLSIGALTNVHASPADDFFGALGRNDAATVRQLLAAGFDANARNADGQPALLLAVRDRADAVARALLDAPKLDVDETNRAGETALMIACLLGDDALVRAMVEQGAAVDRPGWTPLSYAATNGHTAIARYLLQHGARVDAPAPNGTTPLMMAAYFGHLDTVRALLAAGANPALRNGPGYRAIDLALRRDHQAVADALGAAMNTRKPGQW